MCTHMFEIERDGVTFHKLMRDLLSFHKQMIDLSALIPQTDEFQRDDLTCHPLH